MGQRDKTDSPRLVHNVFFRGGYQGGDGTDPGKDLLPISGNGLIVVTVQYRLGVFGFLPGQKVKDGGALNAGLRKFPSHVPALLKPLLV